MCSYSQRNSIGTDIENVIPGNLCIMKQNFKYQQKAIFSIKKYLLYNLRYLVALKTLNTSGEVFYFK